MDQALLISVRLLEGRFHGTGDWPPAPARLFQALIAGAARGRTLPEDVRIALGWLEGCPVTVIAAPKARKGQRYTNYVPNNDLDYVGGDPRRVAEIRAGKFIQPLLFEARVPFIYCWLYDPCDQGACNARVVCTIAEQLYQFGRGIDIAWAWGEVIDENELEARIARYEGTLYRPTRGDQGCLLDCPERGSVASLEARYAANQRRFSRRVEGKKVNILLTQAPKPRFRSVSYNSPPFWRLFELRSAGLDTPFAPWPQERVGALVVQLRDAASQRLVDSLPDRETQIERALIGRNATEEDKTARVRITPLPSIGHVQADRGIRRVLLEVPRSCELGAEDIAWAFSGLPVSQPFDENAGEKLEETRLSPAPDLGMLKHFGVGSGESNRLWRTVTPAALPQLAARRRIDPSRLREGPKDAQERQAEEGRAATAVLQALRHAGIRERVDSVRVQREPYAAKGARAEAFAPHTRFVKERLWHVEIRFAESVEGPLLIGDGRYMGLGLMEPVRAAQGAFGFSITAGLVLPTDPEDLAKALRRAVMVRVQERIERSASLPAFFSGHAPTGAPLREGNHGHLSFAADLPRNRLLVLAPHLIEGRAPTPRERDHLETLGAALDGLTDLRAGAAGRLTLLPFPVVVDDDPLFAPAQHWESVTDYRPTRHAKRVTAADALVTDVLGEIRRQGMSAPEVDVLEVWEGPRGGLAGRLRFRFKAAQAGPILIGRTRHFGGGLFQPITAGHAQ